MNTRRKFEVDGFVVVDHVFDQSEIRLISSRCEAEIEATVGTRNLLKFDWVKSIASTLMTHEALTTLMPNNPIAVQCNYFAKDAYQRRCFICSASSECIVSNGRGAITLRR